jgi:hypothetical protein
MRFFLESIDLSDNIQRSLSAVRGLPTVPAYLLAGALLVICAYLAPLIWYFDLDATLDWVEPGAQVVVSEITNASQGSQGTAAATMDQAAQDTMVRWGAWLILGITVVPSIIELFTVKFALGGIRWAQVLIYGVSAFDLVTDWPRVVEFCSQYRDSFDALGLLAPVVFWLLQFMFLLLASFGFEVLFIVFLVTAVALIVSTRGGAHYTQRGTVRP